MDYKSFMKRIESLENFKEKTNCLSTALYILGLKDKDLYQRGDLYTDPLLFNANKLDEFERIETPKKGYLVSLLGNPPRIAHVAVVTKVNSKIETIGREKHEGPIQKKTLEELIKRYNITNHPHYIRFYRLKENLEFL